MNKETFYMQLCYALMNKYRDNHFMIDIDEFDQVANKHVTIKHRRNGEKLEVVAFVDEQ